MFRAETAWVRVDVQAGEKNRLLSGLAQEDFVVYDEGVPQKILYFGRDSEPLDVLLLLDVSGSMHRYLEQMAATAREALAQLNPQDRVAVMLFSRRAELREEFATDLGRVTAGLKEAVREKRLGSGTQINASIIAAAEYIGKQPAAGDAPAPRPSRRAILIVTDNQGLNYQAPDEQVLRALYGADTTLNAIVVGPGERPAPPKPGQYVNPDFTPSDVFHLAEETGGEAVKAEKAGESFRQMIERIRTRYILQYRAPESAARAAGRLAADQPEILEDNPPRGVFRRIRVDLSPTARKRYPNAWVRARKGYYAAGQ